MKLLLSILVVLTMSAFYAFADCPCCPPDDGGGQGDTEGDCYTQGETEATDECIVMIGVNLPDLTIECRGEEECFTVDPGETIYPNYNVPFFVEGAPGYTVDLLWSVDNTLLVDDEAQTLTYVGAGPATAILNQDVDMDNLGDKTVNYHITSITAPAGMDYGDYTFEVTATATYQGF